MKTKVNFLAHQVMLEKITLNNVPEKYREEVKKQINNENQGG